MSENGNGEKTRVETLKGVHIVQAITELLPSLGVDSRQAERIANSAANGAWGLFESSYPGLKSKVLERAREISFPDLIECKGYRRAVSNIINIADN